MIQVLIVDDDADIRDIVTHEVRQQGWAAAEAGTEAELTAALRERTPDIILLDIRLPDQDGLTIARRLRATSAIPIIMLTGMGSDIDRIVGLEMGADDYVVKPFNPRELVARIYAVLRRMSGKPMVAPPSESLGHDCRRFAGWLLDRTARVLTDPSGNPASLTNAEYLLLEALVDAPHRVLSRDHLVQHSGDPEAVRCRNRHRMHANLRLRKRQRQRQRSETVSEHLHRCTSGAHPHLRSCGKRAKGKGARLD